MYIHNEKERQKSDYDNIITALCWVQIHIFHGLSP